MITKTNRWDRQGYLLIAPFLVIFIIFTIYPNLYSLYLGFTEFNGFDPPVFNGTDNLQRLWFEDRTFWISVGNTWSIWLVNFIPQLGLGLFLSYIFTYSKVNGMSFFRMVFYFPNLVTAAAMGQLFYTFSGYPDGLINQVLTNIGWLKEPYEFMRSPLYAQNAIAFVNWLMWYGYTTVILMVGLTSIPYDLYEAAKLEGASNIQIFWKITLPILRPTLLYILVTSLIGGMQMFDIPYVVGNAIGAPGAPEKSTLTMMSYFQQQGFNYSNLGYAGAISLSVFLMVMFITVGIFFLNKHSEN